MRRGILWTFKIRGSFLFMNNQEIHLIGSKYYSFSILSAYLWILSHIFRIHSGLSPFCVAIAILESRTSCHRPGWSASILLSFLYSPMALTASNRSFNRVIMIVSIVSIWFRYWESWSIVYCWLGRICCNCCDINCIQWELINHLKSCTYLSVSCIWIVHSDITRWIRLKLGVENLSISLEDRFLSTICWNVLSGLYVFLARLSKNSAIIFSAGVFWKIISWIVLSGVIQGTISSFCISVLLIHPMNTSKKCESHWITAIFSSCSERVVSIILIHRLWALSSIIFHGIDISHAVATDKFSRAFGPKRKWRLAIPLVEVVITPARFTISSGSTLSDCNSFVIWDLVSRIGIATTWLSPFDNSNQLNTQRFCKSWACCHDTPWIVSI